MQGRRQQRKRCDLDCKDHIFSFKKLKGENGYQTQLLFCPKYQREPFPTLETHPVFNQDRLYYTTSFILGVDKKSIQDNALHEYMGHQKLIKESCEKINQICFPRPNIKEHRKPNCAVCREHYINYYFHIASDQHRQNIHQSLYNDYLLELCDNYRELWEGAEERAIDLANQSQHQSEIDQEDDLQSSHSEQEQQEMSQQGQIIRKVKQKAGFDSPAFKQRKVPLLADVISKRIFTNTGKDIKPIYSRGRKTDIPLNELHQISSSAVQVQKAEQEQRVSSRNENEKKSYRRMRQKTGQPTVMNREESQTVVKEYGDRKRKQRLECEEMIDENVKRGLPVRQRKSELEPYEEYMRKMSQRRAENYQLQNQKNQQQGQQNHRSGSHPQMLGPYDQSWNYPYYSLTMGVPNQPTNNPNHPFPNQPRNFMGNTNISINFPMCVYPPMSNYPMDNYSRYPYPYTHPPYPPYNSSPPKSPHRQTPPRK